MICPSYEKNALLGLRKRFNLTANLLLSLAPLSAEAFHHRHGGGHPGRARASWWYLLRSGEPETRSAGIWGACSSCTASVVAATTAALVSARSEVFYTATRETPLRIWVSTHHTHHMTTS